MTPVEQVTGLGSGSWADRWRLSIELGEVLGWESKFTKRGWMMRRIGETHWSSFLSFAARLDDCRIAEMEIERRGLALRYSQELVKLTAPKPLATHSCFRIATADAETRCRAMLAAVRGAK